MSIMALGLVFMVTLLSCSNEVHSAFPPTLINEMAKVIRDNYCSPERLSGLEEIMSSATNHSEILNIEDHGTFASLLSNKFKNVIGDPRLQVTYEPDYIPVAPQVIPDIPPEQLAAMIKKTVNVEVLEDEIAYLKIQHIIGEEIAQKIGPLLLQHVWDKVLPTSAMILDFRSAVSGEFSGIPYIVSYYTNAEPLIHINSVYNRPSNSTTELWSMPTLLGKRYGTSKPLIILTSKNTVGVAEDITFCLKNLKRATVVGENTAGGSVKIDKIKIGETRFYISVPVAKSINPVTGTSWEVKGVAPDVAVDAEHAIDAAVSIIKLRAKIPAVLKATASLVAENYAFESIGATVAEKLEGLSASSEYDLVSSKEELETKLTDNLLRLSKDKCLKVAADTQAPPPMNASLEMLVALVNATFQTSVFENNVGYLRFDMFREFEQVAAVAKIIMQNVWSKVMDTDVMIIDLRNNVGGAMTPLAGLCSYFFDGDVPIMLDKLHDRASGTTTELFTLPELTGRRYGSKKGLLILTSGVTAGAAEEFLYIMKKFGRAMIIGEPTLGSCHPPKTFRVGNSDIFLSVPTTRSVTAQGTAWEGAGIAPHVPVAASAALDVAKGIISKHFLKQK